MCAFGIPPSQLALSPSQYLSNTLQRESLDLNWKKFLEQMKRQDQADFANLVNNRPTAKIGMARDEYKTAQTEKQTAATKLAEDKMKQDNKLKELQLKSQLKQDEMMLKAELDANKPPTDKEKLADWNKENNTLKFLDEVEKGGYTVESKSSGSKSSGLFSGIFSGQKEQEQSDFVSFNSQQDLIDRVLEYKNVMLDDPRVQDVISKFSTAKSAAGVVDEQTKSPGFISDILSPAEKAAEAQTVRLGGKDYKKGDTVKTLSNGKKLVFIGYINGQPMFDLKE